MKKTKGCEYGPWCSKFKARFEAGHFCPHYLILETMAAYEFDSHLVA